MRSKKMLTIMVFGLWIQVLLAGTAAGQRPSIAGLQAQIDALMMVGRPFLAEMRAFGGNFEPDGWMYCNGRLLAISSYPDLYSVVGNTYGGDGRTTFAIPDLRGRVPMGVGAGAGLTNRKLGQKGGAENVTLTISQLPAHDHTLRATNSSATQTAPAGNILARAATPQYLNATTSVLMGTDSIGATGSNAPHPNIQPYSVLQFIIAADNRIARFPYTPSTWDVQEANSPGTNITADYEFTSGGLDWIGIEYLLHDPNWGNFWLAVYKNHDLEMGPVTPMIVLEPFGPNMTETKPEPRWSVQPAGGSATAITTDYEFNFGGVDYIGLEYLSLVPGIGSIWVAMPKKHDLKVGPESIGIVLDTSNKFDDLRGIPGPHWRVYGIKSVGGGLTFTSGGVDYSTLEFLTDVTGIGTIWAAIPRMYDLETGPVVPMIVLCPDVVTPSSI